jgi:ribonuclease J
MIAFVKAAEDLGKKVALEGRSIKTNMDIAKEADYFIPKKDTLIDIGDVDRYPADKIVIIATGGQGEKYAALPRMARGDHKYIKINKRDTIIFSSSVIPGNEIAVRNLMDIIMRRDPRVIHYRTSDVHSTGHGNAEELSYIIRKVNPKYFIPGYGFHSMLKVHKQLAINEGVPADNVLVADNGSIIEMNINGDARILDIKAPSAPMMIDGNTVSEVQKIVMEDRISLSTDGFIHVVTLINVAQKKLQKSPDIISRGFIYLKDSQSLISQTRSLVVKVTEKELQKNKSSKVDILNMKKNIQNNVERFLTQKTNKKPIVIATVLVI